MQVFKDFDEMFAHLRGKVDVIEPKVYEEKKAEEAEEPKKQAEEAEEPKQEAEKPKRRRKKEA